MGELHSEKNFNQPTVFQGTVDRSEIKKRPEYFSMEMGGYVPHGSRLVKMFCNSIKKYDTTMILNASKEPNHQKSWLLMPVTRYQSG